MTRRPSAARPGYTLLEILAATAIGVMLLGALYVAYDLTLRQSTIGRELTTDADLTQAVVRRVGLDLNSALGTLPPKSGQSPASGSSSSSSGGTTASTGITASGTGTTTSGTGTTGTGTTATDPAATTTDPAATTSPAQAGTPVPLQSGIFGVGAQLTAFVSRPPKYLADRGVAYDPAVLQPSDLTRVTYYLHSSGRGLCRQERPWVSADGVWDSTDPDRGTEEDDLIAPEVVNVVFEFASGSGWVSDWDGSAAGTDGASCQGPPRAVKMTLTFEYPVPNAPAADPVQKVVSHVYPIRAAVGLAVPPTSTTAEDTTGTTGTGTTGTGTTGGN